MIPEETNRRRLASVLVAVFLLALCMGSGPGLLLANTPATVSIGFGLALPALYAWGLLWYAVEATCIALAYFLVWPAADGRPDHPEDSPQDSHEHDRNPDDGGGR